MVALFLLYALSDCFYALFDNPSHFPHSTIIPSYAFVLFLTTIISGLGFSASRAQLLSVPPNIAGAFFTILAGILADRWRARGAFILVGLVFPLVGYAVLYTTSSPGAGYAGTIIAACGIYPAVACIVSWTGANFAGEAKRAVVLAMVIGFGNLGGFVLCHCKGTLR